MLALMVAYIQPHRRFRRYHIFHRFFSADWPRFIELFRIGLPIGLMRLAEVLLFTSASLLQGWLGQDEVAAHAIALQLASITFMVPLGLSQARPCASASPSASATPRASATPAGRRSAADARSSCRARRRCSCSSPHAWSALFLDPANPGERQRHRSSPRAT